MDSMFKQIVQEIPAWFRGTTAGAAVLREHQQTEETARSRRIENITTVKTAYRATRPALQAAIEKENANVRTLELALQDGKRRQLEAFGALEAARRAVDVVVNEHAGFLRDTQPVAIIEFIHQLEREHAKVRRGLDEHVETVSALGAPRGREHRLVTNAHDVGRRLKMLTDIRQAASTWHLEVATAAEAAEKIAAARRTLGLPPSHDGHEAA
jgi:hypothetical protein